MSFILRFTVLATLKYAVQYCWLWSPCCLLYPVTYLGLEICASWSPPWILPTHPQLAMTNLLPISMWSWRRQWHPTPVLLPGKSHGRRSLVGCSPWGCWRSDTTEWFHFHFSLSCIGEGNGNPLQCSCLENPRDGGAWWAAVYGVAQSWTQLKQLSSSSSMWSCSVMSDSLRPHGL